MNVQTVPPLRFPQALLFFGLPGVLQAILFWGIFPLMDLMAFRLFVSFASAVAFSMALLLLLSISFYIKEKFPSGWNVFAARFRLTSLNGTDWLWTSSLIIFVFLSFRILSPVSSLIAERFSQPKFLIRLLDQDPNYFMELPVDGNILLWIATLFVALLIVFGQELWFRGYVLPRQEAAHGKTAWIINGLLWTVFFLFLPWFVLRLLPAAIAIPYVAQRLRNTWPGIFAHFALFLPVLIRLLSNL